MNQIKQSALKYLFLSAGILLSFSIFAQNDDKDIKAGDIKLKDFKPVSIYKTPVANVKKAKYPAYDMHTHDYVKTKQEVDDWVKTMDEMNIAKSMILTYATGKEFDSAVDRYSNHKDRFIIFCGFDYTGADQPGWSEKAVAEL